MSFQWILNKAESMSMDCRPVTGQTFTRGGFIRSVNMGAQTWRFDVKLPDGMPWSANRQDIEKALRIGQTNTTTIQVNDAGYNSWLTKYQGDCATTTGFIAAVTQGSNAITLTASPAIASGYKFRAGDLVQIGTHVYAIAADVPFNSINATVNRPVLETTGSGYAMNVGPAVTWNVICTEFPQWNIMARDQVAWSGAFVFHEVL